MPDSKKPSAKKFVLCPTCSSKSKVLRTEFGGHQVRLCKKNHVFGYDKWIADRAFWGVLSGRMPNPFD